MMMSLEKLITDCNCELQINVFLLSKKIRIYVFGKKAM